MDNFPVAVEEAAGEPARGVLGGSVLNPKSKIEQMNTGKLRLSIQSVRSDFKLGCAL